jgi:hypothetical protein
MQLQRNAVLERNLSAIYNTAKKELASKDQVSRVVFLAAATHFSLLQRSFSNSCATQPEKTTQRRGHAEATRPNDGC